MRTRYLPYLAVGALCVWCVSRVVAAQVPPPAAPGPVVAIRAARLLDPKSGAIVRNAVVVVQGANIGAVGAGVSIPSGARVIDLGDVCLLPGLIDAHTHLLQNYEGRFGGDDSNMALTVATMSAARRALLGAAMGREDLEAGITTVRDLGNSGWNGDVALRDAINAGWVVGPRIVASTRALAAAGGQFGGLAPEAQSLIQQEYVVISGVEEARKAVRQAFYDGADVIKVIVDTGPRIVSLDEMRVIVEEAKRVGKRVAAHAIGDLPTRIAAEAGVNSIEHAYVVPDDVLKMMAEKGIYLVATDYPADAYVDAFGDGRGDRATALVRARGFESASRLRLQRAVKAGVKLAFGSDEYYQFPKRTRGQASLLTLEAYQADGLSPLEVIRTATVNAADLLGLSFRIGTIEQGKFADLIAIDGDPLKDVRELAKVRFVMKGGQVIRNDSKP
jgi:imidazolonepropionase-like amidohydrolase